MKCMWNMILGTALLVAGIGTTALTAEAGTAHRVGGGANYWVTLDDIDDEAVRDSTENGWSYFASYQYWPTLIGFELVAEMYPDWINEENAYSPEAYLLLGGVIYAGAGVGIMYIDGDWADDPFFALKVGLNLELLPSLYVDIAANYRFETETEFEGEDTDIDTDTVFLGAAVRMGW
jgi:hypothetical protein